jgi:hypothetical protein
MTAPVRGAPEAVEPAEADQHEPLVTWISDAPRKPLCDVPWLGGSIVMSTGDVNFCCFSGAVVGNVNVRSFQEIWNGSAMQRIRQSLISGSLPPECRSGSCPIYRGDDRHYLLERMSGGNEEQLANGERRTAAKIVAARSRLLDSRIRARKPAPGGQYLFDLDLVGGGEELTADLFVAIESTAGQRRFLPDLEEFAVPLAVGLACESGSIPIELDTAEQGAFFDTPGLFRLCAALFECGTNPNLLSNCYWAGSLSFRVT